MKSILPNSDITVLQPINTVHGVFQVKLIEGLGDYGLFLNNSLLAIHNNGYSCHSLAERIVEVWEGKRDRTGALEQFDYILACGGIAKSKDSIEWVLDGCLRY